MNEHIQPPGYFMPNRCSGLKYPWVTEKEEKNSILKI
jgi:hypothetical protein